MTSSLLTPWWLVAWRGHDFPEHLPLPFEVERVPVTVEESVHYPPLGASVDEEWLSIASPSYGYIRLGPEDRTFVITMFHELHCLRMINRAFSKMVGANVGHIKHCLNYIRQGILCDPDLTLEPGNFEERDFEVERVGGTHMCLNWDPLYEWVDENYFGWVNRTGWGEPLSVDSTVLALIVCYSAAASGLGERGTRFLTPVHGSIHTCVLLYNKCPAIHSRRARCHRRLAASSRDFR